MTYVYRDPKRWRPVDDAECTPIKAKPEPKRTPLPEPLWGGPLGLALAAAEVNAWERLHPAKQHREESSNS